jgi:hypothetical protein
MAAVMGYALRRTSARAVLTVGAFGLLWTVVAAQPYVVDVGKGVRPIPIPRGPYRVLGLGFSPWDFAAAALVAVMAVAAAVVLWRERRGR